jgi:hypothetical protein
VAIVCNVTPAAAQAEETHNTLKFAQRAKLIRVAVSRNEVCAGHLVAFSWRLPLPSAALLAQCLALHNQ